MHDTYQKDGSACLIKAEITAKAHLLHADKDVSVQKFRRIYCNIFWQQADLASTLIREKIS